MIARSFRYCLVSLLITASASSGALAADRTINPAEFDAHLCRHAQQFLINAEPGTLTVREQFGEGNGFHVIQMDTDGAGQTVSIAMETLYATADRESFPGYVACKMVDRARVNDVLGMTLPGPDRQCRDVNEDTHARALALLTPAQRERYLSAGRPLLFADDALVATGGEWLPIRMDGFIRAVTDNRSGLEVRSPSVRVPWNAEERVFFQGTQHCKLITLTAMTRWMTAGAFDPQAGLLPDAALDCSAPHSMTSNVGSCLFYFGPARAMFCQDYSGADWTAATAQEECALRHASEAALRSAENRYAGAGGTFSNASCDTRTDTPALNGTCVFNCRRPDETLWHISGTLDPRMTRGCDLFVPGVAGRQ